MNNSQNSLFSTSIQQLIAVNQVQRKLKRIVELSQIIDSDMQDITVYETDSCHRFKRRMIYVEHTAKRIVELTQQRESLIEELNLQ